MSSNRQYPIPSYAIIAILVALILVGTWILSYRQIELFPVSTVSAATPPVVAESVQVLQSNSDYELRPCINQYTGEYAYLKTDMVRSVEVTLSFVNRKGQMVVMDLDDGSVYSTDVYDMNLCPWKQPE